ncbi:GNAT family N-acetyltransferase [Actinomadura rubrisoli]|uniref:GNAT family N-acetyltransferase n=1 Tax=Actinomadura rubrisoli TaxID=2530368 RepID=A0A4R5AWW8_9ACTN|nr:GNAT family N-acetyltransferase [Actinomadura rubrisoli]TDD76489.1 GNAT family N-acetyltransferase [Actinomadura rubrisoli]
MLNAVTPVRYAKLASLFGPSYPNLAFVHAALEGKIPAKAWAQQEGDDVSACLIATQSPFCFAAGAITTDLVDEIFALLRDRPPVRLIFPPGTEVIPQHGFRKSERIQFSRAEPGGNAFTPAEEFDLQRTDARLFEKLNWRDMVLSIFGSAANYLMNGYGFCLVRDGRVAAEGHGVVGGGLVELGGFTHPRYRHRNLYTAMSSQIIRYGAKHGLRPVLSCQADNEASVAVANRIGLATDFRYDVAVLSS